MSFLNKYKVLLKHRRKKKLKLTYNLFIFKKVPRVKILIKLKLFEF